VVSQIEQGQKEDPRISTMTALARALGVTVDELAAEEDGSHAVGADADSAPRPVGSAKRTTSAETAEDLPLPQQKPTGRKAPWQRGG
jgi:transcriptional regulator with XRE-family HTH domain